MDYYEMLEAHGKMLWARYGPSSHFGAPKLYSPERIADSVGKEVCYVPIDNDQICVRFYLQGMLIGFDEETPSVTIKPVRYTGHSLLEVAMGIKSERFVMHEDSELFLPQAEQTPVCVFLALNPQARMEGDYRERVSIIEHLRREGKLATGSNGELPQGMDIDLAINDFDPRIPDNDIMLLSVAATAPANFGEYRIAPPDEIIGEQKTFDG